MTAIPFSKPRSSPSQTPNLYLASVSFSVRTFVTSSLFALSSAISVRKVSICASKAESDSPDDFLLEDGLFARGEGLSSASKEGLSIFSTFSFLTGRLRLVVVVEGVTGSAFTFKRDDVRGVLDSDAFASSVSFSPVFAASPSSFFSSAKVKMLELRETRERIHT